MTAIMNIAYHDGQFLPLEDVSISPLDRGYLLGDGVYEAIPVYHGHLFELEQHLRRLTVSLESVRIAEPMTASSWIEILNELVSRNGGGNQSIYLQVTRGVAPRNHVFPLNTAPSVFAMSRAVAIGSPHRGLRGVTIEDNRWGRCDIKSISLLANVLFRQQAKDQDADEAILLRDGEVTEGAASNVFVVRDGAVTTPVLSRQILAGVTRQVVLDLAREANITWFEGPVSEMQLRDADEILLSSSSMEVSAVVSLDGRDVGDGTLGPVWLRLRGLFDQLKESFS